MFKKSLELIQNIRKQIDYKKISDTNQTNRIQDIRIKSMEIQSYRAS